MISTGFSFMSEKLRILTLAQWSRGADWRVELPHSSPCHALVWITRGQGRFTVEGLRRGLGVHNALAIPAGTLFSLDTGSQNFGLVCLIPPGGPVLMPDTPQHLRVREVHAQAELTAMLDAMQREQALARPFNDEALQAHATLMTVWLRRAMIDHGVATQHKTAAERLIMAYCALVERDYASGKPMAEYARALGVTPTHLTRSCRQCAGLTAAELLTQRTLHAALCLIEDGEDPIRHVAAQLGFASAAYFSRFVLHHTGQSPSALRKRARTRD